jgi:hypothetical protein
MLTPSRYGWVAGLLLVGCYSPSYHNGHLQCTSSGECPEGYHCAADNTCWQEGHNPDAAQEPWDAGNPDVPSASEDSGQSEDAISVFEVDLASSDAPESPEAPAPDAVALDAPGDGPVDAAIEPDALDAGLTDDSGKVTVPLAEFANDYAIVVCTKNFRCCTQADLKGKSLATCESNIVSQLQSGVQAISDGIDRGRTVYNPDRAYQCLHGIALVDCPSWPIGAEDTLPAGCGAIVSPQVTSGGACRSAVECTTGFCSGASSTTDGTCLPRAASGEICTQVLFQNSCQEGLFCDSTNICSATEPEGSACTQARNCISRTCSVVPDAGAGSVCVPAECYSSGPLLPAGCSMGGRPSAFPGVVLLVVGAACLRRRRSA